jgi:uncharacterized protein (TIGR00297 family)
VAAGLRQTVSLSGSGITAALLIGAAALVAGWRWAALLVVFFIAATAVSRFRRELKIRRSSGMLEKTGPRDSIQVLANGAAFAIGAFAYALSSEPVFAVFAVGSLAAASADTWATEIGLLAGHAPRSIISGRTVPPGFSGGVTLSGTAAGGAGALVVAVTAVALGVSSVPVPIVAGGLAGMLIDSVLGATIQEHRWCAGCARATERRVHTCGVGTTRVSGVRGMGNDAVNALATVSGGAFTLLVWRLTA